jgi:hypothetical protein
MTDTHAIAAALEAKDYKQAAQLIKQLQKESPDNPWVQYYMGRYYELTNNPKKPKKPTDKFSATSPTPKSPPKPAKEFSGLKPYSKTSANKRSKAPKTNPTVKNPDF